MRRRRTPQRVRPRPRGRARAKPGGGGNRTDDDRACARRGGRSSAGRAPVRARAVVRPRRGRARATDSSDAAAPRCLAGARRSGGDADGRGRGPGTRGAVRRRGDPRGERRGRRSEMDPWTGRGRGRQSGSGRGSGNGNGRGCQTRRGPRPRSRARARRGRRSIDDDARVRARALVPSRCPRRRRRDRPRVRRLGGRRRTDDADEDEDADADETQARTSTFTSRTSTSTPSTPRLVRPLQLAASLGDVACASALMDAGARVDVPADMPPLVCAAAAGRVSTTRAILRRGADPLSSDGRGATALHYAAARGHAETCRALAEIIAEIEEDERAEREAAAPSAMACAALSPAGFLAKLFVGFGSPAATGAGAGETRDWSDVYGEERTLSRGNGRGETRRGVSRAVRRRTRTRRAHRWFRWWTVGTRTGRRRCTRRARRATSRWRRYSWTRARTRRRGFHRTARRCFTSPPRTIAPDVIRFLLRDEFDALAGGETEGSRGTGTGTGAGAGTTTDDPDAEVAGSNPTRGGDGCGGGVVGGLLRPLPSSLLRPRRLRASIPWNGTAPRAKERREGQPRSNAVVRRRRRGRDARAPRALRRRRGP